MYKTKLIPFQFIIIKKVSIYIIVIFFTNIGKSMKKIKKGPIAPINEFDEDKAKIKELLSKKRKKIEEKSKLKIELFEKKKRDGEERKRNCLKRN